MTIQRSPHAIFAPIWLAWYLLVLLAVATPGRPLFGALVLAAFLPIEGIAVAWNNGSRDTLSELATWAIRQLTDRRDFARGWNAMLLALILLVAWLLARTVAYYTGVWQLGGVIGGLVVIWLYDHWQSPDVWG